MEKKFEVRCNNCDWEGYENDLEIIEDTFKEERFDRLFLKGCPNCKTDDYLMDIEN
jgi:Zn finger protein HypA/HybF involved in hydrogenase expression